MSYLQFEEQFEELICGLKKIMKLAKTMLKSLKWGGLWA